ncbi:uncharacterized protein LOC127704709 isoform X2 [Mytilus californianus]|uniref:uncharacterized protein LOC127704709 isoform X2 n=1 Tax=Mytilus californianus TaxID=6549 RepID=UPI0022479803|nr:uncharacterized protein LOC127704709 isoform X2 [Mytilus californianus]
MKATISFHCEFCRDGVDDRLLQYVQLEIKDHPDLTCKVEDNQVLIEGCLRTDIEQERKITGEIVCIHWKDAHSFLTKSKHMRSCSTVMVQVDTPKNHFITIHCNFSEDRVILLDSFQCTNGLEMYPELALELEHLMKDLNISLIPVAIQKEINDGFFHSFMNSLTVEWSKLLTTQQTYEIFLNELEIFQGLLKSTMTREKSIIDHDMNRNGNLKRIVKERIQSGVAKGKTLEDIKDSMKTVCQSLTRDIDVYIELKYAKCVADKFLIHLQNTFETQGSSYVVLRSEVQNISEIKGIKEPFDTIQNYKQLQKCATLLDSKSKIRFLKGFHDLCHYNSTSEKEIEIDERNFLNELQNHMKNIVFNMSQASEKLPKYLKNAWKKSYNAVYANDLLKKISKTNDRSLSKLQSLALKLSSCHSESFIISLGRLFGKFYEKMSTSFVTENGVDIFRCEGTFVDLRTVKTKIKAKQDLFEKCSQIEIQAELYFCVNCDVKWRGKNVIIVTDTLIVDEDEEQIEYSLDVSGKNGLSHLENKARNGTEPDRDGLAGEPGRHGESGGNVQIIANVFKDVDDMTVISNGGDGSDGQHGGTGADGINGVDGKEISEVVFNKRFPDVAQFDTLVYVNNFKAFKKNNSFTTVFEEIATGLFNTNEYGIGGNYYFKGVTDDNHAIEYGVWSCGAFLSLPAFVGAPIRQSYCFCSGQPGTSGTPGGNGGAGGKGGKGGFQGKIDIRNWKGKHMCTIKTSCHPGQCGSDGKDGRGGIGGKNGKNGNDRAHICPSQARSTRVYTGHLSIVAYETSTSDMSYCPKREKYIDIKRKASEYPTLQRCKDGEKGQSNKRHNNRMTETSRTKKAPIVFKKIKERFQHMFYSKDDSISLQDNVEANTTRMEDFTSYTSSQHIRKVIKDTREHDYENQIQSKQLAPVCIAKKSYHFNDTPMSTFERNHHLEKFLMQKVETAVAAVLTAVNKETKEAFPDKELCTIFAIVDQMSIHNSFDEKHYEHFLDLIYLIKNKCMKPFCEENWTYLHVNYWKDRIMINFKFYVLENVDRMVRLYTKEKEREMYTNDPYSKTIMDDLQLGLKTLFKHLIWSVLKSDDVSYLKTMEQSVQKQLDDLMQEITDYRRTVSLFGGKATMWVAQGK